MPPEADEARVALVFRDVREEGRTGGDSEPGGTGPGHGTKRHVPGDPGTEGVCSTQAGGIRAASYNFV